MSRVDPQHMWMLLSSTAKSGKQVREIRMEVLRRDAITKVVKEELRHIPRGEKRSLQNYLRFFYNALRRHHMAKTDKIKEDTLKEAILSLKKINQKFHPKYDKEFFKIEE